MLSAIAVITSSAVGPNTHVALVPVNDGALPA